jgi:hypothetical protein
MGTFGHFSPPVAAIAAALALAGCSGGSLSSGWGFGSSDQPPQAEQPGPEIPATIRVSEVIGRWGYAAFHKQEDRTRTEAAARSQCNHPFVIGQGPTGGVMMYLADQSELRELRVKGGPGGKNFIGPAGQTPGPQDREITSFDGRVMTMVFVDSEISGRYGTGIYVRCAPSAGGTVASGQKSGTVASGQKK